MDRIKRGFHAQRKPPSQRNASSAGQGRPANPGAQRGGGLDRNAPRAEDVVQRRVGAERGLDPQERGQVNGLTSEATPAMDARRDPERVGERGAVIEEQARGGHEVRAVSHRASGLMAKGDLASAAVIEEARSPLARQGAALLIVGAARGAESEDANRRRGRGVAREHVALDFVEHRALDVAPREGALGDDLDEALPRGGERGEVAADEHPQREAAAAELLTKAAHERGWILLVVAADGDRVDRAGRALVEPGRGGGVGEGFVLVSPRIATACRSPEPGAPCLLAERGLGLELARAGRVDRSELAEAVEFVREREERRAQRGEIRRIGVAKAGELGAGSPAPVEAVELFAQVRGRVRGDDADLRRRVAQGLRRARCPARRARDRGVDPGLQRRFAASSASSLRSPLVRSTWPEIFSRLKRSAATLRPLEA